MIPHSRPWITGAEEAAVVRVVRSGLLVDADATSRFRTALADGGAEGFLFSSGRQAVHAALRALSLPAGKGVVVQTYVCDAVIWAIREAGLTPVLCDIGDHWTATPETIASVLDESCGAILLAPPFGFQQSAEPFRKFSLPIIQDLCQAAPMTARDMRAGILGDMVTLSFHPTKYICAGGGGAVLDRSGMYRGRLGEFESALGEVASFSAINAALGLAQIERLPSIVERRTRLFEVFHSRLPASAMDRLHKALDVPPGHLFRIPLDTGGRAVAAFFPRFAEAGIIARHGVDQLAHRAMGRADSAYPNAAERIQNTLSLPFYPALGDADAERIAAVAERLL